MVIADLRIYPAFASTKCEKNCEKSNFLFNLHCKLDHVISCIMLIQIRGNHMVPYGVHQAPNVEVGDDGITKMKVPSLSVIDRYKATAGPTACDPGKIGDIE